jgi:predicted dehydrogenase
VEVTCTDGMLRFDSYSNRIAVDQDGAYQPIDVQRVDPFTEELKNLVGTINGQESLRASPAWGRHIVEVLLAAEESSRTGREVAIEPGNGTASAGKRSGPAALASRD